MIPSFIRKLLFGLAMVVFLSSAKCAWAQVYIPRDLTIKCQQLTNMTASASFEWRSGQTPVAGGATLACSDGFSFSTRIYQPPSADTWALTIRIEAGGQVVAECKSTDTFPPEQGQQTIQSCAGGGGKATFTMRRSHIR